MNTMTITTPVEEWLAGMGLTVTEVGRCPVAGCEVCDPMPEVAAA